MSYGRTWSPAELALLRDRYPSTPTRALAAQLGRSVTSTYARAAILGVRKSAEYLSSPAACRLRRGLRIGAAYRYQKGHVPANKGLRRPGWAPGRMRDTQFKKGQYPAARWDPERYAVGALRLNPDGYVDMKVRDGLRAWRAFHRILWEDAHGPIPRHMCLVFRDRDPLNIELANLELITRAEMMRRNSVHNLPRPLRSAIQLLGQVKRRIRERVEQPSGDAR